MKKKKNSEESGGSWLDTYADMVTLLLTFFVVLFSMSSVQQEKFEALVKSLGGDTTETIVINPSDSAASESGTPDNAASGTNGGAGTGLPTNENKKPSTLEELYAYVEDYVKKQDQQTQQSVEVEKGPTGVVYITFNNSAMFKPDQAVLQPKAADILKVIGDGLKGMEDKVQLVQAAGYVADTKDPNYKIDDWELSSARAASVIKYLQREVGIKYDLLRATGLGTLNPIGNNDTMAGRQQNRRVELTIVGNEADIETVAKVLDGTFDRTKYPATGDGILGAGGKADTTTSKAAGTSSTASAASNQVKTAESTT